MVLINIATKHACSGFSVKTLATVASEIVRKTIVQKSRFRGGGGGRQLNSFWLQSLVAIRRKLGGAITFLSREHKPPDF